MKYFPSDTYIFENNFFRISESGFWKPTKESEIKASSKIENIYIDSPHFTLIPNEIAGHIPLEEKKRFISNPETDLSYLEDEISKYQCMIYWGVDEKILSAIKKKFPTLTLKHFCESIIMTSNYDFKLKYFLGEKCIYIASYNNKKLILVNRYKIENSEDALYFLLSVIKESKFINEPFNIEHCGIDNKNITSKLKDIFPHIEIQFDQHSNFKNL